MTAAAGMIGFMKTKNFFILILSLLTLSATIWLAVNPTPHIRTIVTETHKQISNLKNVQIVREKTLVLDEKYLDLLGFNYSTNNYPAGGVGKEHVLPYLVTAVSSKNTEQVQLLLESKKKFLKKLLKTVVFDLGLGSYDLNKLKLACNFTSSCEIRKFKFDDFPSHVTDLDIKAYKPVCIQIILKQHQAVFWSDANRYFVASTIDGAIKHAQKTGFSAWTLDSKDSTSTLTHPKMFGFFNTKPEDYHFHRMVEANNLILYNTQVIQDQLMLPWVQCALVKDCVAPYGAQATGCSFIYKPRYKYSGCHRYEMSGLNIILGQVFKQNESQYTVDDVMFGTRERYFNLTRTIIKSVSKS